MKALPYVVLSFVAVLTADLFAREGRPPKPNDDVVWKSRAWENFTQDPATIVKHDFMLQTAAVKEANVTSDKRTFVIFDINNPGITHAQFQLEMKARWEEVRKQAAFELWTYFADGSEVVTKALSDSGPMQKLTGSSPPHTFWLPFANNSGKRPTRLVLNLVFEGKGTVFIGPTSLTQTGEEIRLPAEPVAPVNENEVWASKPWQELTGRSKDVELIANDTGIKGEALKLVSTGDGARTIQFLEIDAPPLTQTNFRFDFPIRYENVEKVAFIEMWTHFSDGGVFFSRTLADLGPQEKILGMSPLRTSSLPFFNTLGKRPKRLVFNLVFNGPGTVYIGRPKFLQSGEVLPPEAPKRVEVANEPSGWWSERSAGILGGSAGAVLGLCGSLVGMLTFFGKARRMALALLAVMLLMGVLCLITGVASLIASQPYHIFYPLLLIGAISTLLPLALYNTVRARFEDVELERMETMDA